MNRYEALERALTAVQMAHGEFCIEDDKCDCNDVLLKLQDIQADYAP